MNLLGVPLASNVSLGTANIFSYAILAVVAIFLISGTVITYIYYRKNKRENMARAVGTS